MPGTSQRGFFTEEQWNKFLQEIRTRRGDDEMKRARVAALEQENAELREAMNKPKAEPAFIVLAFVLLVLVLGGEIAFLQFIAPRIWPVGWWGMTPSEQSEVARDVGALGEAWSRKRKT